MESNNNPTSFNLGDLLNSTPTPINPEVQAFRERIARPCKPTIKLDRPFQLPPAPTFHPTEEEFADPAAYIASIRKEAERFGICKVVPPESFSPRFALDIEKLNTIGAMTRPRLNFMENIKAFYLQCGLSTKTPQFCGEKLDLYLLHCLVDQHGGYHTVSREKRWLEIGQAMGRDISEYGNLAANLRVTYDKYLKPYLEYINTIPSAKPSGRKRKAAMMGDVSAPNDDDDCGICLTSESLETLLMCEVCDVGVHLYCLEPKLKEIPECAWYCPSCLRVREVESDFKEGEPSTLLEFSDRADEFREDYLKAQIAQRGKNHLPLESMSAPDVENLVEEEFWRLVDDPSNQVVVQHGVDLSGQHYGSGFPTTERDPTDPISRHPWNINNFPSNSSSLLSYLDKPIPGLTVPSLSVGQCFSTFCWHSEPHSTYSISYQHWGAAKTWYGIPANHASMFEVAFRRESPKLLESQRPTTTLSPAALTKHGLHVYAFDQYPGEFVITFPRAHLAGFNHGLNCHEAVNFAPVDWLPHGLECVAIYQSKLRPPLFPHHELLLRAATTTRDPSLALALQSPLEEMRELSIALRTRVSHLTRNSAKLSHQEEVVRCTVCHTFCFIMSVGCKCQKSPHRVTCLDHCPDLCDCVLSERIFNEYVTTADIRDAIKRLASPGSQWIERYTLAMKGKGLPRLPQLEELLSEAHRQLMELPEEAAQLSKFIDACREWRSKALLVLEANKSRAPEDLRKLPPPPELANHVHDLNDQAKRLGFSSQEKNSINVLSCWIGTFCSAARVLMGNPNPSLELAITYQGQYEQLGLIIDEGEELVKLVNRLMWCTEANELLQKEGDISRQVDHLRSRIPSPMCSQIQSLLEALNSHVRHQPTPEPSPRPSPQPPAINISPQDSLQSSQPAPPASIQTHLSMAHNLLLLSESPDIANRPSAGKPTSVLSQVMDYIPHYPVFGKLQECLDRVDPWIRECLATLAKYRITHRRSLQARLSIIQKQAQKAILSQGHHGCICFPEDPDTMNNLTVACSRCGVNYHTSCLKIAGPTNPYICPICDVVNPYKSMNTDRISYNELMELINKGLDLAFVPPELALMLSISRYLAKIGIQSLALSQAPTTTVIALKDQLRLLESIHIYMEKECLALRHRICQPLKSIKSIKAIKPIKASTPMPALAPAPPSTQSAADSFSIESLTATASTQPISKDHTSRPHAVSILPAQSRTVTTYPHSGPQRGHPYSSQQPHYQYVTPQSQIPPSVTIRHPGRKIMVGSHDPMHTGYYSLGQERAHPLVMTHSGRPTANPSQIYAPRVTAHPIAMDPHLTYSRGYSRHSTTVPTYGGIGVTHSRPPNSDRTQTIVARHLHPSPAPTSQPPPQHPPNGSHPHYQQ